MAETSKDAKYETRTHESLPGYTLSSPPLVAQIEIEDKLNLKFELRYIQAKLQLTGDDSSGAFNKAFLEAQEVVMNTQPFAVLSDAYLTAILTDTTLTPLLAWACLMRDHRDVKPATIEKKLTAEQLLTLRPTLLELFGFERTEPTAVGDAVEKPTAESADKPEPAAV